MHIIAIGSRYDLVVSCCKKRYVFDIKEIERFEASSSYTLIYTKNRNPLVVAKVLHKYEQVLTSMGFIRVHRTHLVNRDFIERMTQRGYLVLKDHSKILVPRRKQKLVKQQVGSAFYIYEETPAE